MSATISGRFSAKAAFALRRRLVALQPNAGELSRAASRWVACRTHRLTLRRPLPNHRMLDGFPGSWRCGGIIGNVTDGPKSGIPIAADPATVERSGFAIGLKAGFLSIAWGNQGGLEISRKSHWRGFVISRVGRLFFYESSAFHEARTRREGEAGRSGPGIGLRVITRGTMKWARDAVSQETCRPTGAFRPKGSPLPTPSRRLSWLIDRFPNAPWAR